MQTLCCAHCGLEVAIDDGDIKACAGCGGTIFVPFRLIEWSAALTVNDRRFLRSIRVADT